MDKKVIETMKKFGLKVTVPRTSVLDVFQSSKKPLSADDVIGKLENQDINDVTVYRTLSLFERLGILRKIDLRKTSVFYELTDYHHHHIICEECGDLEDFEICIDKNTMHKIKDQSQKFKIISDHSLEFFGICNQCVKV